MHVRHIISLCIILVVAGALLVLVGFWRGTLAPRPVQILTIDDLPAGAILIDSPDTAAIAQEAGSNAMFYYATPDALKAGGPIFGTFGYRIVSISYEIPIHELTSRPTGNPLPGGRLALEGLGEIPYDHFYVRAVPKEARHANTAMNTNSSGDMLLIHFMLISHEEEVADKLACRCGGYCSSTASTTP